MSDPNVSAEIEDVLTSIRRLISSDDRAGNLQQNVKNSGTARPTEPGRLVLTPALRVNGAANPKAGPLVLDDEAALARSNALKARVAELEKVVARQADQWEPDGISANVNAGGAGAALRWEDLTAADSADPEDLEHSAELHDMVADIVRQELEGAMGERVTHNLRKLVRREIQLALAERGRQ